jgi:uncharacterized protein YjiS (DUF1127 family)
MIHLRSLPSHLDIRAFQPPRYDAPHVRWPTVRTILAYACGAIAAVLRHGRQTIEARRIQKHLLELDDRLLRDVGLTRTDVRFRKFSTVTRQAQLSR